MATDKNRGPDREDQNHEDDLINQNPNSWEGQPKHPSSKAIPAGPSPPGCCDYCGADHEALVAYGTRLCMVESSIGGWMELNTDIRPIPRNVRFLRHEVQSHQRMGFWDRIKWLIRGYRP